VFFQVQENSRVWFGVLQWPRRLENASLDPKHVEISCCAVRVMSANIANIAKNVIGPFVKIAFILRLKVCTIAAFLHVTLNK
jgi:NADH:ubiquinone oxidoreductase subunit B-like Fe-S oxidoreductase